MTTSSFTAAHTAGTNCRANHHVYTATLHTHLHPTQVNSLLENDVSFMEADS